jgi:hypothetical protein
VLVLVLVFVQSGSSGFFQIPTTQASDSSSERLP